ncbi:GH116 family glycosyl-hydrolase [Pseudactinotalea sp. Z1732]|uniref:GH116 family glycosyl-hydrolase n=1 Tax=Pseudactinotalea sp. Z1732 TaxID=3413026 RepID=UPI003C7E945A
MADTGPRSIPHALGPHVALPLGGIGTGNLALGADGGLRQWQLHNIGNHRGDLPGSFFALRVSQWEPPFDAVRILQAPAPAAEQTHTPLVNDDHVPNWQRELLEQAEPMPESTFTGQYPFGRVDFHDETLPVQVSLEAFTPFVPLDVQNSSLPAALFTLTLTNHDVTPVAAWLGGAIQNAVGGDGVLAPDGVRAPGYGGNVNRVNRDGGWTNLVLENPSLSADHPGAGSMVLACDAPLTTALPAWTSPHQFLDFMRSRQPFGPQDWAHMPSWIADPQPTGTWSQARPSPTGATWNGGLAGQIDVPPGQSVQVRFVLTWHFPNRYVNFTQFGGIRPEWGATRHRLGNHYTTVHADALAVSRQVQQQWKGLESVSRRWVRTVAGSGLSATETEHLLAQAAIIRSPSFFRDEDGRFYGFEGVHGASTTMWSGDVGGSCPLNCTHVFAYAQGLAKLFPELERSMRRTQFEVMQAPPGFIPHRLIAPTHLPQLWDRPIGGPGEPALDGMLATVLQTYREVRTGAGQDWLRTYWPNIHRLLEYVAASWDPQGTGMLHGIQPSTHDIDLAGLNTFMGTYWLAALRAGEELARLLGHTDIATRWREWFERSSVAYDDALFTGEYYIQVLEEGDPTKFQWERGCLSDQLIGQWWAHTLDLGYLLPADHVRTALASVVRHNLRTGFDGFDHPFRSFAVQDETGLLMCSWPHGGRPATPTRYCDEVWTGIEQQVAAHCLMEGLTEEADAILTGLWARYDGRRRNPYNQVECGDHYVRALSGWTVLEARTGHRWDATTGTLQVAAMPDGGWPVLTDGGWGTLRPVPDGVELTCRHGRFEIERLVVDGQDLLGGPLMLATGEGRTIR